jgi:hypothetical protein
MFAWSMCIVSTSLFQVGALHDGKAEGWSDPYEQANQIWLAGLQIRKSGNSRE